jgi:hypothetical protein
MLLMDDLSGVQRSTFMIICVADSFAGSRQLKYTGPRSNLNLEHNGVYRRLRFVDYVLSASVAKSGGLELQHKTTPSYYTTTATES